MDSWTRGSVETFAQGMADSDHSLQKLIDWAQKRRRPTVIAYFGDHLPPMGPAYVGTGFLSDNVAPRTGPAAEMKRVRETPLVVWSNRKGPAKDLGTVSPVYMPYLVLRHAGIQHPYYTGILGRLHDAYPVVDRQLLIARDGSQTRDWSRANTIDPLIEKQRLMQYDILFGNRYGERRYFPRRTVMGPLIAAPHGFPALISPRNPV